MAIPYQPQNPDAQQSDGNILVTWNGVQGATGYVIQRSTDGVNFTTLASLGQVFQYVDSFPGIGIMFFYQVAATNSSGTSVYSSIVQMVAAPPSEMSLFELRLRSQQTADRVHSNFVTTSEWNAFIRLAAYELYDLEIGCYEDLFSDQFVLITTNGTLQNYPFPDGATNYLGGTFPSKPPVLFPGPATTVTFSVSGSTYDHTALQFTGGALSGLDQRPANATFYAAWTAMLNANWSGPGNGSLTVTPFNGAAINAGVLDLTGSTHKYVEINPAGNADAQQILSIEFQVTPNYSGTPPANNQQFFFLISRAFGNNDNTLQLFHWIDGHVYFDIYNSAGALAVEVDGGIWAPVAGTTYTYLVQMDITNGANKIFRNGTQISATDHTVATRDSNIGYMAIGRSSLYTNNANFTIENFSVYSAVVSPTSPVLSPTIYAGTTANLPAFTYPGPGAVLAWQSIAITDTNGPGYTLNGLYWNGSAWVTSNGSFAQSSSSATVIANFSTLPLANTLQINVIYPAGSVLVSLTSASMVYQGQVLLPLAPAPALYKIIGVDLAINNQTTQPAFVTLNRFDFIQRNKYIYPNSTSTIYGVYNMRYRPMGKNLNIIPTPAGNQQLKMYYAPRLPQLLKDTDITTIGFSGWLRYVICRSAKYALDKEEGSDTAKLDAEIVFLKKRIEEMAANRDAGIADTISETRTDPIYGGNSFAGGGGNNAGW